MRNFEWAVGYRAKISAEVAGKVLEPLLEESNKLIVTKQVVDIARDPKSPIHDAFEWDDSKAAEEFRLVQARTMLSCLRYKVERLTNSSEPVHFFVNVKPVNDSVNDFLQQESNPRRYTSIENAMKDPQLRRQVLGTAFREFQTLRRKYDQFEELASIFEEIDRVVAIQEQSNPAKKRLRELLISA